MFPRWPVVDRLMSFEWSTQCPRGVSRRWQMRDEARGSPHRPPVGCAGAAGALLPSGLGGCAGTVALVIE